MANQKKKNSAKSDGLVSAVMKRIERSAQRAHEGKITYVIGNNGAGKSRLLGKLAEALRSDHPTRYVACIANSIHDRFTYVDRPRDRVHYLGARNASNAVFHTAVDRQLSRLILRAMQLDRGLLARLAKATDMDFTFRLSEKEVDKLRKESSAIAKSDMPLRGRAERKRLMKPRALAVLDRICRGSGRFEYLTSPQLAALLGYLDLNPDIQIFVSHSGYEWIRFGDLSTGEQSRVLLFAKVLSVMREGAVFLIDEPEISMHLHWQMEVHEKLTDLLSGLRRFHAVIATHAPIIISEAARFDATSSHNMVAVLQPQAQYSARSSKLPQGPLPIEWKLHSFKDVASHEQLILRYFKTAPYEAREVSVEITETILRVAEGSENSNNAVEILRAIQAAKGISVHASEQITAAIELISSKKIPSVRGMVRP